MDAKKKRERSLFCDFLIVICLCIPFGIVALLKAVISLVRKVSAYLQSEWKRFNGLYFGDRCETEQQSDPALIAHIKGEGPVPGEKCPQTTAKIVESRRFKKTTQQTNEAASNRKGQKHTSSSKQQKVGLIQIQSPPPSVEKPTFKTANGRRAESVTSTRPVLGAQQNVAGKHNNVSSHKDTFVSKEVKTRTKFYLHCLRASRALINSLLLVPRKVCTYVQRVLEDYSDIHGDGGEDLPYIEPAFIAYLKGEEGAPFIDNPHIRFSRSASRNLKDVSADSEIMKKGNQRQEQKENVKSKVYLYVRRAVNAVVNTVLFVPQKVKAYVRRLLEDFNDIHGDSMADLPYTEPAFIAYLKGEEGAPFINNPHVKFSKSGSTKLENVSVNSAIVEGENQRQGQTRKVTEGVFFVLLVKGLYRRIRGVISALNSRYRHLSFRAQVNGTISQEVSSYYNVSKERNEDKATTIDRTFYQAEKVLETVATHSDTPAHVVSTEQGRLFKFSGLSRTAQNLHTSPSTGMDIKPKLFSSSPQQVGSRKKQWNASPAVGKRSQTQVKLPNNGKADSAATTPAPLSPTEEKPNKTKVPPCVNSSSHVDVSAPNLRNTGMYTGPKLFSVPEHWNTPPTSNKPEEKQKETKVTASINSSANADVSVPTPSNTGVYTGPKLFSVPEFWDTPPTINKHEEKPKETKVTTNINSFAHADVSAPTPSNTGVYTGPKLFSVPEFWNTPPTINKPNETDVQLSSEGKARRDVMTPPPFDSNTDSAAKTQKCRNKAEKKAKKKVAQDVILSAHVDVPVPTPPAEEKAKRKDMPRFIQTACNYLLGCVRTHVQEQKSSIVAHSTQMLSADVCSDSQVLKSQNIEQPLIKQQMEVDSTVSRGKRTKKEEDSDKTSWHVQASIGRTESPQSECRNAKRKAEISTCINLKSAPLLTASRRQRYRVNEQKQETVTSMLSEPMDVSESPPETPFTGPPEPMETGGEQYAVVFPCGELGETNQPPVNRSFVEDEEPMDIECDESEPMEIDPETSESEAMETNQGTFLDEFSFAWENIMQTFFNQAYEEMEIDPASVPATPCTAQLEEIMESMQEPAVIPMPFGKFNSFQWPLITSMKTSGTTFALPNKATVEINQELVNACKPVETASGYVCNGDRSLAFTVEVPKGIITTVRTPAADQAVIEPVLKPLMASPLTDQVTSPPLVETETQPSGEPSAPIYTEPLQSLEDRINDELAAKQSVIDHEPMIKPDIEPLLIERVTSPPLEKTETQPSSKPSANIYSEHLQRMEEKLNNEPNTAAIEQQALVAVETEEEIPATQLTMEQLQLIPELGYFPDGLDSDSDEEDSDEEYELDFATIDQFLELDAEPEHIDLINQLLTKKELASELE